MPVDNDSDEGRKLLYERDKLIGEAFEESDPKALQALKDRVDAIQKQLGQDAHYGGGKK